MLSPPHQPDIPFPMVPDPPAYEDVENPQNEIEFQASEPPPLQSQCILPVWPDDRPTKNPYRKEDIYSTNTVLNEIPLKSQQSLNESIQREPPCLDHPIESKEFLVDEKESKEFLMDEAVPERQRAAIKGIIEDILDDEVNDHTPCCENCTEMCFTSCSCNFCCSCILKVCKISGDGDDGEVAPHVPMTEALRKAKTKGWRAVNRIIFPIIPDIMRDIWVAVEILTILAGLVISIATLTLDQNRIFNIVYLALASASTFLALVDGFYTLKEARSCRRCCKNTKDEDGDDQSQCFESCRRISDFIRVILTEIIVYPLFICSIFEVIIGRDVEGKNLVDRLSFALFIISCISWILYVYLFRLIILSTMIKHIKTARTTPGNYRPTDEDRSIQVSAFWYQIYFVIHVVLQMLVQICMLVAIGGKIRYDNRHFYGIAVESSDETSSQLFNFIDVRNVTDHVTDQSIYISGHLWYMIVAGYINPLLGFLTFFVVTYYWTEEFPIGLFVNMLNICKLGTKHDIIKIMKVIHHGSTKKQSVFESLNDEFDEVKDDFLKLHNASWYYKIAIPFTNPAHIVVCILYMVLQAAFIICAAVAYDEMGTLIVQILNGGGWAAYYLAACIIGALANLYVLLVAALWIAIIAFIIALIAIIIAVVILYVILVVLGCLCKSDEAK